MSATKNFKRYPELRELLNQALESERGIKVRYPTLKQAEGVRFRMHTVIGDSRRESKTMFELEDERWGKSPYDGLATSLDRPYDKTSVDALKPGYVIIEKVDPIFLTGLGIQVEEL